MKVIDTFSRTVSNGWGTSDSGHQWVILDGPPSQYSVSNGVGRISLTGDAIAVLLIDGAEMKDFDAEFKARIFPTDSDESNVRLVSFTFRFESAALFLDFYRVPNETRLEFSISRPDGEFDFLADAIVTGINPHSHQCTLRVLAEGNRVRAKAWNSAQSEPSEWHIDYIDNDIDTAAGQFGIWAFGWEEGDSFEFDDLSIISLDPSPLKVRIGGEWVAATPHIRRNGVWVPVNVSALAAQ